MPSNSRVILIVDDYPDSADALALFLKHQGYPVQTDNHGREVIAFVRSHPLEAAAEDVEVVAVVEEVRLAHSDKFIEPCHRVQILAEIL
jgi:CheY-like chemotaxis protein